MNWMTLSEHEAQANGIYCETCVRAPRRSSTARARSGSRVEFALVLPVLVAIMFAMIDCGPLHRDADDAGAGRGRRLARGLPLDDERGRHQTAVGDAALSGMR